MKILIGTIKTCSECAYFFDSKDTRFVCCEESCVFDDIDPYKEFPEWCPLENSEVDIEAIERF